MNREKILDFAQNKENLYLYGDGNDLEPLKWYLENNKVKYTYIDNVDEIQYKKNIGIFFLASSKIKSITDISNFENIMTFEKDELRELSCIHLLSSDKDKADAENVIELYRNGVLTYANISKYTYSALMYIKCFYPISLYKDIFFAICNVNLSELKEKKKVNVGFLVKHSAEWSAESLYRYMEKNDTYKPTVYAAPYFVGTKKAISDNYRNTVNYFKNKQYNVIPMCNKNLSNFVSWDNIECDIMFNLSPAFIWLRYTSCIIRFPLTVLNCYIPYGFYISGFVRSQFNQLSHMMFWKIFCESELHKKMAKQYSELGDDNVEFSGYLKMDYYAREHKIDSSSLWKGLHQNTKKVIFAPHWSIGNSKTGYGNFDNIYMEMLELARQTKDEISWIIKPHPRLRSECVVQGVFEDEKAFDSYLEEWDKLENAKSVTFESYEQYFITSDLMILDSISFMAEYMYVHKPLIFLTRKEQSFNEFGENILKTLYTVPGNDFENIKKHIYEVLYNDSELQKKQRDAFFDQTLDYININGCDAKDYIINRLEGK